MKTSVSQLAAGTFIALLLMVGKVYATGTATATELKASSQEMADPSLQLENWMTCDMVWNTNSLNIAEFVLETEPSMELENWMTNAESWNLNKGFLEETEMVLELEDWITNDATWNTVNNDNEPKLTVENWMVNDSIWE